MSELDEVRRPEVHFIDHQDYPSGERHLSIVNSLGIREPPFEERVLDREWDWRIHQGMAEFVRAMVTSPPETPVCIAMVYEPVSVHLASQRYPSFDLHAKPVIYLAESATTAQVVGVMQRGAHAMLTMPIDLEALLDQFGHAIRADRKTGPWKIAHQMTEKLLGQMTERQQAIIECLLQGLPNKLIAKRLDVSKRLIEKERAYILRVFGCGTTQEMTYRIGEYRGLGHWLNRHDDAHAGVPAPHHHSSDRNSVRSGDSLEPGMVSLREEI